MVEATTGADESEVDDAGEGEGDGNHVSIFGRLARARYSRIRYEGRAWLAEKEASAYRPRCVWRCDRERLRRLLRQVVVLLGYLEVMVVVFLILSRVVGRSLGGHLVRVGRRWWRGRGVVRLLLPSLVRVVTTPGSGDRHPRQDEVRARRRRGLVSR